VTRKESGWVRVWTDMTAPIMAQSSAVRPVPDMC
jgi:hypothetical protein